MVQAKEFRVKIKELLSQDYKIEFLGEDFDLIVKWLSESSANRIYRWMHKILNKEIQPIVIGLKKNYKEWKTNELLSFRYAFRIKQTKYRILVVRVKNSIFIEFHLGTHKYYDKVRKELRIKRNEK